MLESHLKRLHVNTKEVHPYGLLNPTPEHSLQLQSVLASAYLLPALVHDHYLSAEVGNEQSQKDIFR